MNNWIAYSYLDRSAVKYRLNKITLGQAAREADVSIMEMLEHLVHTGYRSKYSVEDFRRAREFLKPFLKKRSSNITS